MSNLASDAVSAALKTDWDNAVKLNKKLLSVHPNDIETLNRLAYALMEKVDLTEAKKLYQKVLRLDPGNPIAERNLKKIQALSQKRPRQLKALRVKKTLNSDGNSQDDISNIFLEEPGKTKITKLKNLAEPHILSILRPADAVTLSIKRHSIFAKSKSGIYIGALPDDIAHRLILFINGGSEYLANVLAVDKNSVAILIKEVKKGNRFKNSPSFLSGTTPYYTFVREDAIKEERRPDVTTLEDLEEELSSDEE